MTHCPAHEDKNPSLSLSETDDGKPLVYCHAGCGQVDVIQELADRGLWRSQAGPPGNYPQREPKGELVEVYSYLNEEGQLLFQSCRYKPKTFRLRRPNGQGGWEYTIKGTKLVPYQLPEVRQAKLVLILEGEKDWLPRQSWV